MIEIERKFLVKSDQFKNEAHRKTQISQGYLTKDPSRTVRIRIRDQKGFITIKGKSTESGLSRFEWEKEIPSEEAHQLLQLCLPVIIEKCRYEVKFKNVVFEIDEFIGHHRGLVLAEVELKSENQKIDLPNWIGEEVTGNKNYYNSSLSELKV